MSRNIRREGLSYVSFRLFGAVNEYLNRLASSPAPQSEVDALLRKAFPDRCYSLQDLAERYGARLLRVGNMNSADAVAALTESQADLGIVIGTRILKRRIFGVPSLGCINLHKGKVPEYRGMPPGFWELYDGVPTAGVTIHHVDDGLDTGDVIEEAEIPIHALDTPDSLRTKLDFEGARMLAQAVVSIAHGEATRKRQNRSEGALRIKPTRAQQAELERRAPHLVKQPRFLRQIFKTFVYLGLYYSGIYGAVRRLNRDRGVILLYHRVNDFSDDPLTTSTRRFADTAVQIS
ncbi:MAG: formyl transferase [Bryobacteraceae bacterium]